MLFRFYFIVAASLLSLSGFGHDSTKVHGYLGAYAGIGYNHDLKSFNENLSNFSVTQVPELTFAFGVEYAVLFNRSKITFNFNSETISNRSKPPNTLVQMNCLALTLNYGFDVLGKNEQFRLEPYLGLGVSDIQLFVTSHDTTATLPQVLESAQNLYYERPSLGFILDGGLRFEWYPKKRDHHIAIFAQLNYQYQVNRHNWKLEDMPLSQLSKLNIGLGARFDLNFSKEIN